MRLPKLEPLEFSRLGLEKVRNFGVTWEKHLSMNNFVKYQYSFLFLNQIGNISKFLDNKSTDKLVDAFISTKLDYCNLFWVISKGVE